MMTFDDGKALGDALLDRLAAVPDGGGFRPAAVAPVRDRTGRRIGEKAVRSALRAGGIALPGPRRGGLWVLTEAGRALAAPPPRSTLRPSGSPFGPFGSPMG